MGTHRLGRFHADGEALEKPTPAPWKRRKRGAGENQKQVSTAPHFLEISPTREIPTFPPATAIVGSNARQNQGARPPKNPNRTNSRVNKPTT